MSQRQTLAIVQALLEDESLGLRATVERLVTQLPNAPTGNPGPLSADFNFMRAPLSGAPRPTTRGNVSITPARWITSPRISGDVREGTAPILIGFETFSASHEDNIDEATLVATALVQCLVDQLADYSAAHETVYGKCVVGVPENGVDVSFGDFEGPTSFGFLARISITEYSSDD